MSEAMERTRITIELKADQARSDLVRGLIWFINYAAIDPTAVKAEALDLHGAAMLPEDVEKYAHRWLAFSRSVDINHDGIGRPVFVVESFFNGADVASPAWPINSHAVRMDVSQCAEAVSGLKDGSLNCVSLDAFTFNKVVRLPAAQAKSALGPMLPPVVDGAWVEQFAREGYTGVTKAVNVGADLWIVQRSCGMPLAVSVKDGFIEASAASTPWAHLAATLLESGTLTTKLHDSGAYIGPERVPQHEHVGPVDFAPWSSEAFDAMLADAGLKLGIADRALDQFADFYTWWGPSGGVIPHHVYRGSVMMVSRDAVMKGLTSVDQEVPEPFRAAAKAHLLAHLAEMDNQPIATPKSRLLVGEIPQVQA